MPDQDVRNGAPAPGADAADRAGTAGTRDAAGPPVAPGPEAAPPVPREPPHAPRGMWQDAWRDLRRNPVFVVAALLIAFLVLVAVAPGLVAPGNPLSCDLAKSLAGAGPGHWFGYDVQGCDVYTRTVHGARASVAVGVLATTGVTVLGGLLGGLAGYLGGVWDSVISRLADVFFGIPILLGGLVFLSVVGGGTLWTVVGFIVAFGWPQAARIARGAVLVAKEDTYVHAARALGAGGTRVLVRHVLPNAVAPVIVVATVALGTYISLEATLSFLGVGLRPPAVSWGVDISAASTGMQFRNAPHILMWPAGALSLTVLAFIMLGDAVRDALDPRLR